MLELKIIVLELILNKQLETILKEHGVVVIARNGSNPQKFVFESDLMFENQVGSSVLFPPS